MVGYPLRRGVGHRLFAGMAMAEMRMSFPRLKIPSFRRFLRDLKAANKRES